MRNLLDSTSDLDIVARDLLALDTIELSDGYTLSLHTECDECSHVTHEDSSFVGELEGIGSFDSGQRPTGFDGAARKIHGRAYQGDSYWWQPPADIKADRAACDTLASWIEDRLTYGYVLVWVELSTPDGCYSSDTLSGVDEPYAALIGEMVSEVLEDYARDWDREHATVLADMTRMVGV